MDKVAHSMFAHAGLFPTGEVYCTSTPAMESTTYITQRFERLPLVNQASLTGVPEGLFDGLYYGGVDTPTTRQLALQLAAMEKGKFTVITPSGQFAINLLFTTLVRAGDHVLVGDTSIYSTQWLFQHFINTGIDIETFSPNDAKHLKTRLTQKTKLIFIENPGAITFEITDIASLAESLKDHPVIIAVDNTWAASSFHHPLSLGADISLLSMSKSHAAIEGISLGALATNRKDIHSQLKTTSALIGNHVSSYACAAALRAITTLGARLDTQMSTTRKVLRALTSMPLIRKVIHPIIDYPECSLTALHISGFNSILTIELTCTREDAIVKLNKLRLIKIGYGWGGSVSIINFVEMRQSPSANRLGITGECLRIYLGLEGADDLIGDLQKAFIE